MWQSGGHGNWIGVDSGYLLYYKPVEYIQEVLENGWNRAVSEDGRSFLALRSDSTGQASLPSQLDHWRQVAAHNATDFNSSQPYEYEIGSINWHRLDFAYQGDDGERLLGILLGSAVNGGKLFVWAEAPEEEYDELFLDVFRLMIASISPNS